MFKDLKVIFMGTPDFCLPTLKMLKENTNLCLVVCQPDKIVGRKKEIVFGASKKFALENNIEVFQPLNIKKEYQKIIDIKADLIITAAYGQIVPNEVLTAARLGALNIHGSLLPKYRGAAPIQRAIMDGLNVTGVTLMYMDQSMDTGDMIALKEVEIEKEDNYYSLYNKLSIIGSELLYDNLEAIRNETNEKIKQKDEEASYAKMIYREDEYISFDDSTLNIFNKIRGIYPNAYTIIDGEILKILEVDYELKNISDCNKVSVLNKNDLGINAVDGIIYLKKVKPFGKKEMDIKSYINGLKNKDIKNLKVGKDETCNNS